MTSTSYSASVYHTSATINFPNVSGKSFNNVLSVNFHQLRDTGHYPLVVQIGDISTSSVRVQVFSFGTNSALSQRAYIEVKGYLNT